MFTKSFLIFGLLAVFSCQGTTATQLTEVERASIGDLIKQIQEIISKLNSLVSGVIGDALSILTNLIKTVATIKEKFLKDGLNVISESIGNVFDFIANKTAEAAKLGVDVTKCLLGTNETLIGLGTNLTAQLSNCVTDTVSQVLKTIHNEIDNINKIIKTITAAPIKLSKCLISLRPLTCVMNLLGDLTSMITTLPEQIAAIVSEANKLVEALPTLLLKCVENIATTVHTDTQKIISEVGTCIDNLISQAATTEGNVSPTTSASPETPTPTASAATTGAPLEPTTPGTRLINSRASLDELIAQVKAIISKLNELVSGVVSDALSTLVGLVNTIKEIKEKYLDDGIAVITEATSNVVNFIKTKIEEAVELGVDISECFTETQDQLEALTTGLAINLTDCITTTVTEVLKMVNADIANVNNIVSQVTSAPVKLAKCLISLKPVSCITNLISDLASLVTKIPSQIAQIIEHALNLVKTLPPQLDKCISDIAVASTTQTTKMITDIGECVDRVISGSL